MKPAMKPSHAIWRAALLLIAMFALGAGTAPQVAAADEPVVSVVVDAELSPAAAHGAGKLLAALRDKGVPSEKVDSLDAAHGKLLIVMGLVAGDGAAAKLLLASKKAPPQGLE